MSIQFADYLLIETLLPRVAMPALPGLDAGAPSFQEQLDRLLAVPAALAPSSPLFPLPAEVQALAAAVAPPGGDLQPAEAAPEATPDATDAAPASASPDPAAPEDLGAALDLAGQAPEALASLLGSAQVAFLPGLWQGGGVLRYPRRPLPVVKAISAPTPFKGQSSGETDQTQPGALPQGFLQTRA
jgi:hypothetical protein